MTRLRWTIAAIVGCAGVASADPHASREHYVAGKAAYTAGHFDVALAEFQRAFAEAPATEYLQDIAQAYRHLGRCTDSIAYFDRYLAASPDAPHRDAVVATVAELRATCPKRMSPASSPPTPAAGAHGPAAGSRESVAGAHDSPPSAHESAAGAHESAAGSHVSAANAHESVARSRESTGSTHEPAQDARESPASTHESAPSVRDAAVTAREPAASMRESTASPESRPSGEPRLATAAPTSSREPSTAPPLLRSGDASAAPGATEQVSVAASAPSPAPIGPWSVTGDTSLIFLHAGPVVMPPVARIDAMARRRLDRAGLLHAAVGLTLAPIPYDDVMSGTAWLGGPIVALDGAWPLGPRVALVGEVAAGVQLAWGMGDGNPFTTDGHASSAIALPYGRVGIGIAWRAAERVVIRVLPIAAEDAPRRGSLAADIPALRGFALRAGIAVDL